MWRDAVRENAESRGQDCSDGFLSRLLTAVALLMRQEF
jgi:hypothetical protein